MELGPPSGGGDCPPEHREKTVSATLTFHPLGNADCTRFDLADRKRCSSTMPTCSNRRRSVGPRIDLPDAAQGRSSAPRQRDYYEVVCFTHLDDDHCCGAGELFLDGICGEVPGRRSYQDQANYGYPSAAILEEGSEEQCSHHPTGGPLPLA